MDADAVPAGQQPETLTARTASPAAASPVQMGSAAVRTGACSWADKGLTAGSSFYPRRTMKAAERLAFYASRLPLVEVTSTFRFPPTPDVARQWVDRTPDGFTMDIRAWSLLSGAPTMPDSLFEDLRDEVKVEVRDRRRLYPQHLTPAAMDECWRRFGHAVQPLASAGRLGVVILQYPSWFTPKEETRAELAALADRLPGLSLAVELRSPKWTDETNCEETFTFLEEQSLTLVCVDGNVAAPPVVAATADVAMVRFLGHRDVEDDPWPWPYRYSDAELRAWVPRVAELAESSRHVHLLFANAFRDDAVVNAQRMADLLRDAAGSG